MSRRMAWLMAAVGLLCVGCAPKSLVGNVGTLEQQVAGLASRADAAEQKITRLEGLTSSIDASQVEAGTRQYLEVLRRERELIAGMLAELDKALNALKKPGPEAEGGTQEKAAPKTPPSTP